MATSVTGKSALVTGAGSGINLCFAQALVARGCNVLIADVSLRPEAEAFVDATTAESLWTSTSSATAARARAVFQKCDVTSWSQLAAAMDAAEAAFGAVDIVCPGAGVFEEPWSNFWIPPGTPGSCDTAAESRYKILDINLTHPIRLTQLAIQHFIRRKKKGNVVCITSIAGQLGMFPTPMYVTSKWGISGFVRSLHLLEPRYGIRVNAVAPGVVHTPLWFDHPEKMLMVDETTDVWVTPDEVAHAMVALIEHPEYPGGTILEVGHGQVRVVPLLMNPGPQGSGHAVSNVRQILEDIWEKLKGKGWMG